MVSAYKDDKDVSRRQIHKKRAISSGTFPMKTLSKNVDGRDKPGHDGGKVDMEGIVIDGIMRCRTDLRKKGPRSLAGPCVSTRATD